MIKFPLNILFFVFFFDCCHFKKLELLGTTRSTVAIIIDDNVFTFNFYSDSPVSGNVTIYEDDKYQVKNSARRVVYVDRQDYSSRNLLTKEKNKTLYGEIVPSLMGLRSTMVYISVAFVVILLVIICFFSYQFSIARKVLKRLKKNNSTMENVCSQDLTTSQHSVTKSFFNNENFKDNNTSNINIKKAKSFSNGKEKNVKFLIMSKTGELKIKTKKIKNFKYTELTPKTLSSVSNLLGFMAVMGINDNRLFDKNPIQEDFLTKEYFKNTVTENKDL